MNTQECASYDIHYIRAHYKPYFDHLDIVEDNGDSVRFKVQPRDCKRVCDVVLSKVCYEIIRDNTTNEAESLVGFRCETFEALIAQMMGSNKWQELLGGMLSSKLRDLQ